MLSPPTQVGRRPRRGAATALALVTLVVSGAAVPAADPSSVEYELELLPGRSVGYHLEFEPAGPGLVTIDADWDGTRVVAVRVDGPASVGTVARRSGPPPLRLEFEINRRAASAVGPWRISLRGLPSREHALGTLRLGLPGPQAGAPVSPAPTDVVRLAPHESGQRQASWQRPLSAPASARTDVARLYHSIERFRSLVIDDARPDGYDWQLGFLEFVSERRDRLRDADERRNAETWRALRGVAEAIDELEALRTTTDPLLLEPPPENDSLRAVWRMMHDERFKSHRRLLDELLAVFRDRQRIPSLRHAGWPVQLVTCLQACRRHFETRFPTEGATRPHAGVVEEQWERLLAAGEVIRRLLQATPGVDPIGTLEAVTAAP